MVEIFRFFALIGCLRVYEALHQCFANVVSEALQFCSADAVSEALQSCFCEDRLLADSWNFNISALQTLSIYCIENTRFCAAAHVISETSTTHPPAA